MILKEFAKYLQQYNQEIIENKTTSTKLLCQWIRDIIHRHPKTNVEKIIHCELMLAENSYGEFVIMGKSDSGRILMNTLNNFALSYENYIMSRWLEDKKPHHFKNYADDKN